MIFDRWATDDPNPRAKAEFKRKAEVMAAQAIIKSLPAEFTLSNTDYNFNKRLRLQDDNNQNPLVLEGGQNSDDLETSEDQQYARLQPNIETIKSNSGSNSSLKNKSIVSVETLENLKNLSQGFSLTAYNKAKETTTEALTGLAEYESDDHESEEEHG
jgi:hypothetical protein